MAPPTDTLVDPATVALLLADGRLPTGGHVSSAGLEPALRGGMPAESIREWMIGRATTVSLTEAGTAVVAAHLARRSPGQNTTAAGLDAVTAAWAARTPSPVQRRLSRQLGRGYVRLATAVWAAAVGDTMNPRGPQPPRSVVLGVIAAAAGIEAASLVRLVVYEEAQAAASAALKLEPQDPLLVAGFVLDACAAAEPHVAAVAACRRPEEIPAASTPQSEGWTQAHSLLTERLFRA
ncbi:urease accessory UreF family protein [Galbitalea soli]|uniref:Urease accessory protein n=1 Tax=Galbitalea soli TaxID=1268042 RepID=A0A7C9TPH2_9MICO|nr:urease accessory UreF family protein [Galbitalea soli]NEM89944.1 urease accessory protein [Galbitalea soli]NYJ30650.1 urease accessory protein [Galbitalea soli]